MTNASGALVPLADQGRFVRVKPGTQGFIQGARLMSPDDPPFFVSHQRATDLVKAGLAEFCDPVPSIERADNPAPKTAGKAILTR